MILVDLYFKNYRNPTSLVVDRFTISQHTPHSIVMIKALRDPAALPSLRDKLNYMFAKGQALCYSPDAHNLKPGDFVTITLMDAPHQIDVECLTHPADKH